MARLIDWLEDHPVITLILVAVSLALAVWAAGLFTWVTIAVFGLTGSPIPDVPGIGGTVAAYGTLFGITATLAGLLAGAIKLWQWRMGKRDA